MIFYKPLKQIAEEAKIFRLEKLKWVITFSCFLLFMYKASLCIKQFIKYETVTNVGEERQEIYPLPQICISQAEIPSEALNFLGLSARGYRSKGLWRSNRSKMMEEEIYERLSTKFENIVDKLEVDVLHKDNDNYDRITIFQRFTNATNALDLDLELTRCDYYYSLQCFCINLSGRLKTRAIQKLYVYMKKNAHVAVVAPGNYYGYERKRNEMYTEVGYSYRYQVYHRISMSLPLGSDPCHENISWEEDTCTLNYLNSLIYSKLNCTTPWLLDFARQTNRNATICRPETSERAAELYNENRYPSHEVCRRSCTKMKISTVYLARYVNEDKMTSYVTFNFGKLIDVSVEVESYRFLNMVAEIGGYLGLTLGVSLHDINHVLTSVKQRTYF